MNCHFSRLNVGCLKSHNCFLRWCVTCKACAISIDRSTLKEAVNSLFLVILQLILWPCFETPSWSTMVVTGSDQTCIYGLQICELHESMNTDFNSCTTRSHSLARSAPILPGFFWTAESMAATTGQGALLQEIHGGGECQMARSRSFLILSTSFNISMKFDQHFDG